MGEENGDELRKQPKQVEQHRLPSSTKNIRLLPPTSNSASFKNFNVKPRKNAFARRKVREQDEAYAAALQAAFDPLAEERHRLVSNAFYQQQQQRKSSGSESSPSSLSSSSPSPTVVFLPDKSEIKRNKKMTKKSSKEMEVIHSRRFSGNIETMRHGTREAEIPERPITAMSHFIRADAAKDGGERVEEKVNSFVRV